MKNKIKALKNYWLITKTFSVICWYSTLIIICSVFNNLSRNRATHYCRRGFTRVLQLAGVSYKLHCQEKINFAASRAYIFMSNHQSLYDIPIIFVSIPGHVRLMAKKELFEIPVFGTAMRCAEMISVNRDDPVDAAARFAEAKNKLQSGLRLWIFPEATRSLDGNLLPFKLGGFRLAVETQAIIIPVSISGTINILRSRDKMITTGQNVVLRMGRPVDAKHYALTNLHGLMREVENRIANLMET